MQGGLVFESVLYAVKDHLFALNNRKILSISKIEDLAENSKKIRLISSGQSLSKGDRLLYILGSNYFLTLKPYRGLGL